jgi:hypothetical protein
MYPFTEHCGIIVSSSSDMRKLVPLHVMKYNGEES